MSIQIFTRKNKGAKITPEDMKQIQDFIKEIKRKDKKNTRCKEINQRI